MTRKTNRSPSDRPALRSQAKRPILLVFTLGPARDQRRRRLLGAGAESLERGLYRRCLDDTLAAGRACGCELVVAAPPTLELPADARRLPQTGRSFGERLRGAVAAAAVPDRPLLVVGTDTPGIDADLLRRALRALVDDPGTAVVGPARDGGFYLLAADPAAVDLDRALSGVSWKSRRTLATLRRSFGACGIAVTSLEPRDDLDRRPDLERWLRGATRGTGDRLWTPLTRALLELLAGWRQPSPAPALAVARPPAPRRLRGRAPPAGAGIP